MVRQQEHTDSQGPGMSRISIDDVRKAGYCVRGAKTWFEDHGMDFRDFLVRGIDQDEFILKGDHKARIVVEKKIERCERSSQE